MTLLLDERVPRTLDIIVRDWSTEANRGARSRSLGFRGRGCATQAEARLAEAGVTARIRSAYKPLVHAFLEDDRTGGSRTCHCSLPCSCGSACRCDFCRRLIRLPPCLILWTRSSSPGADDLTYRVTAEYLRRTLDRDSMFCAEPSSAQPSREIDLTPTGWLRVKAAFDSDPRRRSGHRDRE